MPAFMISVFTLLLLLSGSCSTTSTAVHQKGPWSLDLKTTGGFIGAGKGNIAIDSEGNCTYTETNRDKAKVSVTRTLNPRQLQPISDAVAQLATTGWDNGGLNVAAPDAYGYILEFTTGANKDVMTVQWYDNTAGHLPDDLKRLDVVLEQTMKARCGGPQ